jgi:RNA polymerase sigma-70 factor (ECF subfamily)
VKTLIQYDRLSEPEIWELLKVGDIEALSFFYQKYYADLFFYGKKFTSSPDLAKDCIQELFLRIWKKQKSISKITACKAYLFKSYRRLLIDKLKEGRKSVQRDVFDIPGEVELSIEDLTIEMEIDVRHQKLLEQGLKSLSKKQKEIIYLRFYRDLGYQEIAEVLDINNQSVRNTVYEALKTLKKSMIIFLLMLAGLA